MEIIDLVYEAAYGFVAEMSARLERGEHVRDCFGVPIFTLDQLTLAIEDGRWPAVETQPREVDYALAA